MPMLLSHPNSYYVSNPISTVNVVEVCDHSIDTMVSWLDTIDNNVLAENRFKELCQQLGCDESYINDALDSGWVEVNGREVIICHST
jgi:hypothetical protein